MSPLDPPDSNPYSTTPALSANSGNARQWLLFAGKLALLALLAWGARQTLEQAFDQLRRERFSWDQVHWGWIALGGLLYILGQLPAAQFWYVILKNLGQKPGWYAAIRAHLIGHLGKYVPGKALVVVLRTALIRGPGVTAAAAIKAIFYETFTSMAVGSLLACLILAYYLQKNGELLWQSLAHWQPIPNSTIGSDPRLLLIAVGLAIVTGIPTIPAVFRYVVGKMRIKRLKTRAESMTSGETPAQPIQASDPPFSPSASVSGVSNQTTNETPDFSKSPENAKIQLADVAADSPFAIVLRDMCWGWCGIALGWLLQGASLWATIQGVGMDLSLAEYGLLLTACAALAIVAGFASLIPGGFGVRELVFLAILAPLFRTTPLLNVVVPILLRVEWLLAELIVAGALWFARPAPRT
ncbi:MAG: lysylphosphatidylglycerol synthase domain-containing protein [Pirellulales bacterium]|nr:lysylphosphatidylglycerol synthase domain-containing protein [Pirellulales bacterium]